MSTFNSQKLRGIEAISGLMRNHGAWEKGCKALEYVGINREDQLDIVCDLFTNGAATDSFWRYPVFARPCPTVPRHGFVDSRIVMCDEDVRALWAETRAADPMGELVFMPIFAADYSSIVTPSTISVGLGNDGATQGREGCVLFHYHGPDLSAKLIREKCGISESDSYYIETLCKAVLNVRQSPYSYEPIPIVQVRGGPSLPPNIGEKYQPWSGQITEVHTVLPGYDWQAWESLCLSLHGKSGIVVHFPNGTPTAHASIHALTAGCAIWFCEDAPKVGDYLEKTDDKPSVDVEAFAQGLNQGFSMDLRLINETSESKKNLFHAVLFAVHNSTALVKNPDGAMLVGAAIALFLRYGAMCVFGEWRHKRQSFRTFAHEAQKRGFQSIETQSATRGQVYSELSRSNTYERLRELLGKAWSSFRLTSWRQGYGGKAWAQVARQLLLLDRATNRVLHERNCDAIYEAIQQLNATATLAHNNGWFLNKHVSHSVFEYQSQANSGYQIVASYAAAELVRESRKRIPLWSIGSDLEDPLLEETTKQICVDAELNTIKVQAYRGTSSGTIVGQFAADEQTIKFCQQVLEVTKCKEVTSRLVYDSAPYYVLNKRAEKLIPSTILQQFALEC